MDVLPDVRKASCQRGPLVKQIEGERLGSCRPLGRVDLNASLDELHEVLRPPGPAGVMIAEASNCVSSRGTPRNNAKSYLK